ncbi:MAG: HAMP domain-containing sensor histidine kinase [Rhodospirillales bacterium]
MFETGSILFSLMCVEIVMVVILMAFWLSGTRADGIREMAFATLCWIVATLVVGLAAKSRNFALAYPGFLLFVSGVLLAARAMRALQKLRPRYGFEILVLVFCLLTNGYFLLVENRLSGVFIANSLVNGVVASMTAWHLIGEKRPALRTGCRILGSLFAVFAVVSFLRLGLRPLVDPGPEAASQVVLADQLFLFLMMSLTMGWSLGLLWTSYNNVAFQLRAANAELERFAGTVAHDLKSPLNVIIGYIEASDHLPAGADPARKKAFLANAHEAALRMNDFIDDLLSQARDAELGTGTGVVETGVCWNDARKVLEPELAAIGAGVSTGELFPVMANRLQITRLFQNLLENALKYRAEGRKLEVKITSVCEGGRVIFRLSDNGIGLKAEEHDLVFERFRQSEDTRGRGGYGLGLAECRRIVESFGGSITVDTGQRQGTTFVITLPAAGPDPAAAGVSPRG